MARTYTDAATPHLLGTQDAPGMRAVFFEYHGQEIGITARPEAFYAYVRNCDGTNYRSNYNRTLAGLVRWLQGNVR
jgi:hypothetical protein